MTYEKLDPQLRYSITEEVTLTNLLFADDGNLPSETEEGSQQNTAILVEEMSSYRMKLNTKKCATLSIIPNKRLNTTYVDSTSYLKIDGQNVPALYLNDTDKYLGLQAGCQGYSLKKVTENVVVRLDRLTKSRLKPQQKLHALKSNVIPALQHELVPVWSPIVTLRNLDITIRRSVHKWLHLPSDLPLGMFHAAVEDGGLGIVSLATQIPRLRRNRHTNLAKSDNVVVQALLNKPLEQQELRKHSRIYKPGNVKILSKESEKQAYTPS